MSGSLTWACALSALALAAPALAAPPSAVQSPRLSPKGDRFAMLSEDRGRRSIVVRSTSGDLLLTAPAGAAPLLGLDWVDEDHVAARLAAPADARDASPWRSEASVTVVLDVPAHRALTVFARAPDMLGLTYGYFGHGLNGGRPVVFVGGATIADPANHFREVGPGRMRISSGHVDLYAVDADTGAARLVERGPSDALVQWLVGPDGRVAARADFDADGPAWRLTSVVGGEFTVERGPEADGWRLLGEGRTPEALLVGRRVGEDSWIVREVSGDRGGTSTPLGEGPVAEPDLIFAPDGRLIAASGPQMDTRVFDPAARARFESAERAMSGERDRLVSATPGLAQMILHTEGPTDTGTYYFVDMADRKARAIAWDHPDSFASAPAR